MYNDIHLEINEHLIKCAYFLYTLKLMILNDYVSTYRGTNHDKLLGLIGLMWIMLYMRMNDFVWLCTHLS
jgi:hypothetical protein